MNKETDPSLRVHCASCGFILVDGACRSCGADDLGEARAEVSRRGSGPFTPRALVSAGIAGLLTSLMLSTVSSGQGAAVEATSSVSIALIPTTTSRIATTTSGVPAPTTTLAPTPSPTVNMRPTPATTAKKPRTTSPPTIPPTTTTSTTTTVAPGPHGKKSGTTALWTSEDKNYGVEIWVGTYSNGESGIAVFSDYPTGKSVDPQCSDASAPIYEYASYWSADGGTTSKERWRATLPDPKGYMTCTGGGFGLATLYQGSYWQDASGRKLSSPPPPIHVRFTLKNLRSNTVVESPWVLVDANTLP